MLFKKKIDGSPGKQESESFEIKYLQITMIRMNGTRQSYNILIV
jgi:hypothetical protein